MINITIILIFTGIVLLLLVGFEKLFQRIKLRRYNDKWFDTKLNDYHYMNRKENIKRIMEDMR